MDITKLLAIPFMDKGRDKTTGLDCYGLVQEVYQQEGIKLPEYDTVLTNQMSIEDIQTGFLTNKNWQKIDKPELLCLVAIRFCAPKGVVNHVGVYLGNDRFIHTRIKKGVAVDKLSSPAWRGMIEGYYRYIGGK